MTDLAALQLLVPGAEPLLDAVRGLPRVTLLPPAHVSLGYPWRSAEQADVALVRRAAASTQPFPVRFSEVRAFLPDARGRTVVHLLPDDDRPFRALAARVAADLQDVHLSVARVLPGGDVGAVEERVRELLPVHTTVTVLELTCQADGAWQAGQRFVLGTPAQA